MASAAPPSRVVQRTGAKILEFLGKHGALTKHQLGRSCRVSPETVKRATAWLRDMGAPLKYVAVERAWVLETRDFSLPLTDPSAADLEAALIAAGLLASLGRSEAATRAWNLFKEIDFKLHGSRGSRIRPDALLVSLTGAASVRPRWVSMLLRAARRGVVRLRYCSPWRGEATDHLFEPWQLWLHDGAYYVRGFSRTRRDARTFHLAHVQSLLEVSGDHPRQPVPERGQVWQQEGGGFGMDVDRPGLAIVRFHGPIARWVGPVQWDSRQTDVWIESGQLLERRVPYRSCRELARRLLTVCDGIESIHPPDLRAEVLGMAATFVRKLDPASAQP